MTKLLTPGTRHGTVLAPPSKSMAHRQLLCAALSSTESTLHCGSLSDDITATIRCLNAMGANIKPAESGTLRILPIQAKPEQLCELDCGESGTTLRFLLPVAAALGLPVRFHRAGRLTQRPMDALVEALTAHGAEIHQDGSLLTCTGRLQLGRYTIPGNISSQFISGLLFALPLLSSDSALEITDGIQSAPYIRMTEQALAAAGITLRKTKSGYEVPGNQPYRIQSTHTVEGDWSAAAPFLCMGALSREGISVHGLCMDSCQGDREILRILEAFGASVRCASDTVTVRRGRLTAQTIDASEIPDLIPPICALAAAAEGTTRIIHGERLRYKESDRLRTTAELLRALGSTAEETQDGLCICGQRALNGGTVATDDHRIAMAAAVAACACQNPVTVQDAECVGKSYPSFWDDYAGLEEEV